jgi:hypothetical protein
MNTKMKEVSLDNGQTPFGREMLKHFCFDPSFKNLNQGNFSLSIVFSWNINVFYQGRLGASLVSSTRSVKSTKQLAN